MTSFDITHFNVSTQKEANFLANFIARQDVLKFFLAQLRNTQDLQTAKHHLIVAPRGYGKTSLLRRIKIALREEPEFKARYIALAFREEQHNVISLDIFWRNCLQSLLEAREDEGADDVEIDTLDQLWQKHAPRSNLKRDEQDGALAWAAFADYCRKLGRRPVLLIDNLDALLAGLEQHQWGLRAVLQLPDGPVMLAAASRYPESLSDTKAAFFDFFRITTLPPLSDHEVMSCLRELARLRGEKGLPVRRMLETDPGRISALNTMAGGNPRTLGVLYTVLEAHMSDDVLAQLSAMLDTFTGWYQARTEELPLQSRAVFDALALNWDPMTAADIGKITGLDTPTVSSHLNRLEKTGYAETVSLSKTRKSRNGYQVSERFFNIWYLMRNGPRRTQQAIRFLTIFLRSCFSRQELRAMAKDKLHNGAGRVESTLALAASIGDSRLRERLLDSAENCLKQHERADDMCSVVNEMRKEYSCKDKRNATTKSSISQLLETGWKHIGKQRFVEAEAAFRQTIALDKKGARPWFGLGFLLQEHLGRYEEAEAAYRKAIVLDEKNADTWNNLGNLLQTHLGRHEEAEAAYRKAIALDEKNAAHPWNGLGYLLQYRLGRYEEAEAAYRKAITLDEKNALPWNNLGNLLHKLARYEEAEATYRQAIARDKKDAYSWNNLGYLLHYNLARYEEAEVAYRQAIVLNEKNSLTWNNFGNLLQYHLVRHEEAEAAYRQAIALDKKDAYPWFNLGLLLQDRLERYEEAEAAYRQAIALDKENTTLWNRFGNLLQDCLGRHEDAYAAYQQGLEIDPQNSFLLANSVYLCALHLGQPDQAHAYAKQAESGLSPTGIHLLKSMLAWSDGGADAANRGWGELHQAVSCEDEDLWTTYVDDLQRVLAYATARGDGAAVRNWMEAADYPVRYAPLFHAYCAILDGEDHLLSVNPEVRGMAEKIHRGLARLLALFERQKAPAGNKPKISKRRAART